MFTLDIRMGENCHLCGFYHGVVVGASWAGLTILETPDLLGFSHRTVSRVYIE